MAPAHIQDELLGRLHYDEGLNWYSGEMNLSDGRVEFSLAADDAGNTEPAIRRARQVFSDFDKYANAARDYAVASLLELKNESWLDEDEEPVTPNEFKNRMSLESVVIYPDGTVTFYHNDGDLFLGHCIQISMNENDQFVDADIPG